MIELPCDNPNCEKGWVNGPEGFLQCPKCYLGRMYVDERMLFPWARRVAVIALLMAFGALLVWIAK